MKKWISLLLVSVLIFSLLGMSACGEKEPIPLPEEDSFSISEEELETLSSQVGGDTVVKVWNSSAVSLFGKGLSLQEIINPPYALESGYIHASKGDSNVRIEYIRNNEVFETEAPGVTPKIFFDYICDQPYLFSSTPATKLTNVEVYKVYCILSADAANSVLIYYDTNYGDFVYYLPYATSENEYLLPLDAFQEATKAYRREILYLNITSPGWAGMPTLDNLNHFSYDMSPYLIDAPDLGLIIN